MVKNILNKILSEAGPVPYPVSKEWLLKAAELGLLMKKDLQHGKTYYGQCRNSTEATWDSDSQLFSYQRTKFNDIFSEDINHPEDDDGHDLFFPFLLKE